MLFQTHFKAILHIFSSIFLAAGMLKTTFSLERVVIFKLFLIFVSDVVFDLYWVHFLVLGDPPGLLLAAIWESLGASWRMSCGFLGSPRRPLARPRGQDAPKIPPRGSQ